MKNWLAFGLVLSELAGVSAQQFPGRRSGGPAPPLSGQSGTGTATTASAARDPNVKPGSIEGVVLAASGEPLRKAEVRVMRMDGRQQMGPPDGSTVITDEAGRFNFPSLDPGRYNVFAQRTGYVGSSFGARRGGRGGTPVTLSAGQEMKNLEIKLFKQGVISGRVLDEDGEPLQHSTVQLMQQRYMRGRKQLMPVQGGQVNDLGEYRVASLAPGKYYVSVTPQRMMMRGPEAAPAASDKPYDETYAVMYYPNATEASQATVIEVTQGGEVNGIDFRMRKARTFRVRGKVLDTDGQPARNVFISVAPSGDSFMFGPRGGTTARGNGGTFELTGVAPGSYNLIVNRADRGSRLQMIVPVVVGEQHLNDVNIQLVEPLTVKGVVRVEGKEKTDVGNTRLMFEPTQGIMFGNNGGSVKDGAFEVAGISPGKYRVTAMGIPDGHYIKSMRVANQDAPDRMVDFTAGAAPIEVVLSDKAGQVSGTVQDAEGKAASGITVVAMPADITKRDTVDAYKQTQSDQTGAFSIKSLPPGDWVVFAFADAEDGAYQDPEWIKKYEGSGAKLSIKESGSETATLKVLQ